MKKIKRWKRKQTLFLAGLLLSIICTTCTGCGERTRAEEQGELVRNEAVGEIRQPLYMSAAGIWELDSLRLMKKMVR